MTSRTVIQPPVWIKLCLALLAMCLVHASAQADEDISQLESQARSLESVRLEVDSKRAALAAAAVDTDKIRLGLELLAAEEQLASLESSLSILASGLDINTSGQGKDQHLDWNSELAEIFQPVLREIKGSLEQPRALEKIRSDLSYARQLEAVASGAVEKLNSKIAIAKGPELQNELKRLQRSWTKTRDSATSKIQLLEHQLNESTAKEGSFFDTATKGARKFVQTRGKNLALVLIAFFGTFLFLRWFGLWFQKHNPWRGKATIYRRLALVAYYGATILGAFLAAMIVLYSTADWVLLGFALIFIAGLLLAAKSGLPKLYEQGRLLLNLGEIREGERVVIDGVPWRVDSLGVFTKLSNPLLLGGKLRLPIRALPSLHSRAFDKDEIWFPTEAGDWVILGDDTRGKVIEQTPEIVRLGMLGGSFKTYSTADFLGATPNNISKAFRIRSTFGIDYRHQGIATTTVPEALHEVIRGHLVGLVGAENIVNVRVEFREAGSSSLDFDIIADLKGGVADRYDVIARSLQKAAVQCCNAQNWTIPFPQLTLHRAPE